MGVGLALGLAFHRTRNIWPLSVVHALIDSAPIT
jgi:membrane protease YdiL (CAAX protease family)